MSDALAFIFLTLAIALSLTVFGEVLEGLLAR